MPDLELTVRQAARSLDISERTVRRWVKDGKLGGRRVDRGNLGFAWRISAESVRRVAGDKVRGQLSRDLTDGHSTDLTAEVRSLREEQRQTAELIAARLEKVERALLALPPARVERPRSWWQRLWEKRG